MAYIDAFRHRFGVEPICRVLTEHDMAIAPSTYFAHRAEPVTQAAWDDAHMANTALGVWRANQSLYRSDKLATAGTRWPDSWASSGSRACDVASTRPAPPGATPPRPAIRI